MFYKKASSIRIDKKNFKISRESIKIIDFKRSILKKIKFFFVFINIGYNSMNFIYIIQKI